jgi:serine/threonine protein kinase/tetratricopeptide (TPR) repeat protein
MTSQGRARAGGAIQHYRILEEIGAGGMGVVYRALDERLQREVALKVLLPSALADPRLRDRARNEALALSKLSHPNIEAVYDFGSSDDCDFLVMELVPGVSLDHKLAHERLDEKQILDLGAQMAQGLAAAHQAGLVHCDLKPANLRLTPDGRLKILDFGLAKSCGQLEVGGASAPTTDIHIAGTLPYMAPEQLTGKPVDARTDIWAAGCVLYQMATGRPPFPGDGAALTSGILSQDVVPPSALNSKISSGLESIILKCLDKDSDGRYQSARELAGDLRRIAGTRATTEAIQAVRQKPRFSAYKVAVLIAVIVLAVVTFLWLRRSPRPPVPSPGHIESVAVLPLENLSKDPQQEYFADGMTDELITMLSKVTGLRVISRTSAMRYRNSPKPLTEIARELNVDAIINGSVLWSGQRVRIGAQLIEARSDRIVWSDSYERDLQDVLVLQSDVARAVANSIQVKLSPSAQAELTARRTVSPEAYQLYLKARYYWNKRTEADIRHALDLFDQAIAVDGKYAQAYAGVADCYAVLGAYGLITSDEANTREGDAARKALQLDDNLPEAHAAMGSYRADTWDWNNSLTEYERAIQLNPNYATARQWYAETLMNVGRTDDALREVERAQESDPLSLIVSTAHGYLHYRARQYDEAIKVLNKTLELDPNFYRAHLYLGESYEAKRMYPEAIAEVEKCLTLPGGDTPETRAELMHVYAVSGQKEKARRMLGDFQRKRETAQYLDPFYLAVANVGLGDHEAAFKFLEQALRQHSKALVFQVHDPRIADDLKSDSRFGVLLRRLNFPQ